MVNRRNPLLTNDNVLRQAPNAYIRLPFEDLISRWKYVLKLSKPKEGIRNIETFEIEGMVF